MQCHALPYMGTEPYLFISRCSGDDARVIPLLNLLARDGWRVWYDQTPAGWTKTAEERLQDCSAVVAFVSEGFSLTHSCRQAITWGILLNKPVIPVRIDLGSLPRGLWMQLQQLHFLPADDFPSQEALLRHICSLPPCAPCKGATPTLPLNPEEPQKIAPPPAEKTQHTGWTGILPLKPPPAGGPEVSKLPPIPGKAEANAPILPDPPPGKPSKPPKAPLDDTATVIIPAPPVKETDEDNDQTVIMDNRTAALLLHPAKQRAYPLSKPQVKLGRSVHKCDVVIEGNPSISKTHAEIRQFNQKYFLVDSGSANGTYLGGERLTADTQVPLENPALFRLNNELLILFTGQQAYRLLRMERAELLLNEAGTALCMLDGEILYLNRSCKWPDGTLSDPKVHRSAHARLCRFEGSVYLVDESPEVSNGTFLNGVRLKRGEARPVTSGDRIRLGDTILEFLSIPL